MRFIATAAWAYVQAVDAEEADLADPSAGIFALRDRAVKHYQHSSEVPGFWTYFLNEAWADRMTGIWGPAVKDLGFDGIHRDTLGPKGSDYGSEVNETDLSQVGRTGIPRNGRTGQIGHDDLKKWQKATNTSVAILRRRPAVRCRGSFIEASFTGEIPLATLTGFEPVFCQIDSTRVRVRCQSA
jgi:hypothetical protein